MKIGIIGIGKMGKFHAKSVLNHPETFLTGVYDIDNMESIKFVESQEHLGHKIRVFNTVEELVLSNDAVIVSTPATTHYDVIRSVYAYGNISILCEKPLVVDKNHYYRLLDLTMAEEVPINIGMCERQGDLIPMLLSKRFDNIVSVEFKRYNTGNRNTDVNLIWDTMVHDIDLMFYIFPQIKKESLEDVKIKEKVFEEGNLKEIKCILNTNSNVRKVMFSCGKGAEKIERSCKLTYADGTTMCYDFVRNAIDYGHRNNLIVSATDFAKENDKDKLTKQLDEFILSVRMENSINANVYEFEDCFFLVHKIDSILKTLN